MWTIRLEGDKPSYFLYDDPKDYWAWDKFWKKAPNKPKFTMLGFVVPTQESYLEITLPEGNKLTIYSGNQKLKFVI